MTERIALKIIAPIGMAQLIGYGSTYYLPAILARPIAEDLGVAPSAIFFALSAALTLSAFMGPTVGRYVDRNGGRAPLAAANVLFAVGLVMLASAHGVAILTAAWLAMAWLTMAWLAIGLGMGLGFYETAFAAFAHIYGLGARNFIAGVTLVAGFASTLAWPFTAWLDAHFGWRITCLIWAALNVFGALPMNLTLPVHSSPTLVEGATLAENAQTTPKHFLTQARAQNRSARDFRNMFAIGLMFAATSFTAAALSSTLPNLLARLGVGQAAAIAAAALFGPAQVAARLAEMTVLRRWNSLAVARAATLALPLGLALLMALGHGGLALFVILYGAGNGVLTIARGALPLEIFGSQNYGRRLGRLAAPARLIGAGAPFVFGLLAEASAQGALIIAGIVSLLGFFALFLVKVDDA